MEKYIDEARIVRDVQQVVHEWEKRIPTMKLKIGQVGPAAVVVQKMLATLAISFRGPYIDRVEFVEFQARLLIYLEGYSIHPQNYFLTSSDTLEQMTIVDVAKSCRYVEEYIVSYSSQMGYRGYRTTTLVDDFIYMIGMVVDSSRFCGANGYSEFSWKIKEFLKSQTDVMCHYRQFSGLGDDLTLNNITF